MRFLPGAMLADRTCPASRDGKTTRRPALSARLMHVRLPGAARGPAAQSPRRGGADWEAGALAAVIAAGAAATMWMWWHDGSAPRSAGDWLTDGGRVTGLLGGYGLGVLLLLMSRVPWLERRIGAGRLAGWHAQGGRYVMIMVITHTLLIVWGYAASTQTSLTAETAALLAHYPDVLAATAALGLLLGAWVISARAIRRRVRYETWFYLHLYTYLAAALAFAHEFSVGADFATHPLARAIWVLFYVAVAAALLWYRFCAPVRGALRHRLRITRVRHEAPGVTTLFIGGRRIEDLHIQPGQFFRWRFLTRDGWWQSHPFSLSARPGRSHLRITVKASGDYTRTVQHLRPGVRVIAEGPYGALTAARRTRPDVLLLAGGIGITPLRALLDVLTRGPGDVILLYRADQQQDLVFQAELEHFRARRAADVRFLVGPPGSGSDVLAGDRLAHEVADLRERDVFCTGPPGFTDAALAALSRAGVPRRQIHLERFAL
jgi:predicted ferric reductase